MLTAMLLIDHKATGEILTKVFILAEQVKMIQNTVSGFYVETYTDIIEMLVVL